MSVRAEERGVRYIGVPVQLRESIELLPELDAKLAVHGNWAADTNVRPDGLVLGRGNFTWSFSFGLGLLLGGSRQSVAELATRGSCTGPKRGAGAVTPSSGRAWRCCRPP